MNAIEDNASTRCWRGIAQRFEKPRAILCVSAHWVSEGVRVASAPSPRTIHDFGGFPPALFAVQYPAPGAPELAHDIVARLSAFAAVSDENWGLDHGAWSVLAHMYPNADVPVLQLSLDARRTPAQHYEIGRALAPLREQGVLILGSGNIVHNLDVFFRDPEAHTPWADTFDDYIVAAVEARDHQAIIGYRSHADAARAAPDWDHFAPLLYVLGAREAEESALALNHIVASGISMTCVTVGVRP